MNDELRERLIEAACAVSKNAYVPYSHYPVGAALLAEDGGIYTGCNVENAAYPACICGERSALVKAISEGVRRFTWIVVATKNGGSPCGLCRQMLYEFSPRLGVLLVDFDGKVHLETTLDQLLAHGFGPEKLPTP